MCRCIDGMTGHGTDGWMDGHGRTDGWNNDPHFLPPTAWLSPTTWQGSQWTKKITYGVDGLPLSTASLESSL